MCKILGVPRSSFYYEEKPAKVDTVVENAVISEFKKSRKNYGIRKIKRQLTKQNLFVSRRKIGKIMKKYELVSKYIQRRRKRKKNDVNEAKIENIVNRQFDNRKKFEVVASDLTYIKIAKKRHYLCLLLDLCGRKIVGSAVGTAHDAVLVETAFYSAEMDLSEIDFFHSDRGSEFKNQIVEDILTAFEITRSLSRKGNPYDNAVVESMNNIVKTEFMFGQDFADLEKFHLHWSDFVNWYNNIRIHGSLGYLTPTEWHNLA